MIIKMNSVLQRVNQYKSPILSLGLFFLGLFTFTGVAFRTLVKSNQLKNNGVSEQTVPGIVEGIQSENERNIEATPIQGVNQTPITTKSNSPTPVTTQKAGEVNEVHTVETIELQTVVVVTATPIPTLTITPTPLPTPSPTPDTRPFEASWSNSGDTYTVSANKNLAGCQFVEANHSIAISGDASFQGFQCTFTRSNPNFIYFSMRVSSFQGESITFGNAPDNYW